MGVTAEMRLLEMLVGRNAIFDRDDTGPCIVIGNQSIGRAICIDLNGFLIQATIDAIHLFKLTGVNSAETLCSPASST
jgi:hypothetical protein